MGIRHYLKEILSCNDAVVVLEFIQRSLSCQDEESFREEIPGKTALDVGTFFNNGSGGDDHRHSGETYAETVRGE